MAQTKEIRWQNGATPVALPVEIGFKPCKVTVVDETNGSVYRWFDGMPQQSFLNGSNISTNNGFRWVGDEFLGALPITGIYQAISGTYFTVTELDWFNLVAGVKVKVTGVVGNRNPNSPNNSLNGIFTVASINLATGYVYTVEQLNSPNPYQSYAGGGKMVPFAYGDGSAFPVVEGLYGCILGTGMVGAANSEMCALFESAVSVV